MRTFSISSFLAPAAACLLPLADPARAQPADAPPVQLTRFDVSGEREKSLTVPTPAEAREELARTPGAIEIFEAARYLRGRASTFEDTFALSAGVIAQSRFGSDEARLSIRGSGLQRTFHGRGLRLLQDGVPLNLADGSFDMQAVEPLATAYVNVWRGANALALGASTLGGAIDYISRDGRNATAFARLEAGSWDYLRAHLATGGTRGRADAFASFTHQSQDGFRDHARQRNARLFANAGLRVSPELETRVYVTAIRTDSELPGSLTLAQLHADPRQAAAGNIALDQKRDFDLLRIASKTSLRSGETAWELTTAWTTKDLDHPIFQVVDQHSHDFLVGLTATRLTHHFGPAHRLRAGLLLHRGETKAANFVNAAGRRAALVSSARQTATNLEAFAEDQISLSRQLTLVAGLSAAANRRANDQRFGPTPDYTLEYERVMPKLGLRWDARDVQVYANISGSYEPPSFSETLTLDTPRSAQTARTLELGTRGQRGPLRWDLSVYHAALRHELLSLDHDGNPATPAATINAGRTTHAGLEFAGELELLGTFLRERANTQRLVLRAAYTLSRFRFDDDPRYGNNTLPGLPPHLLRAELMWESPRGWYAGPTVEWSPRKTHIDFRNTLAAEAYAIAGLRVGRRVARGTSWFIEVRNLFDRAYSPTTGVIENAAGRDQPQFLPGDGRGVFTGIDYTW